MFRLNKKLLCWDPKEDTTRNQCSVIFTTLSRTEHKYWSVCSALYTGLCPEPGRGAYKVDTMNGCGHYKVDSLSFCMFEF